MNRTREEILDSRRRAKAEYGKLFDVVSALLFRYDPAGINFEVNAGEYDIETETILPRLRTCRSAGDVQKVVHEEFVRWFSRPTAGPPERYAEMSSEIWRLWTEQGANG
jgi:hypothetical protein